jgi:hypothetical protein
MIHGHYSLWPLPSIFLVEDWISELHWCAFSSSLL